MVTLTQDEKTKAVAALTTAAENASFPAMRDTRLALRDKVRDALVPVVSGYELALILAALMAIQDYQAVGAISAKVGLPV